MAEKSPFLLTRGVDVWSEKAANVSLYGFLSRYDFQSLSVLPLSLTQILEILAFSKCAGHLHKDLLIVKFVQVTFSCVNIGNNFILAFSDLDF